MYYGLQNTCAQQTAIDNGSMYSFNARAEIAPGTQNIGSLYAISAETGKTLWRYDQRAAMMSIVATGGGLLFAGDTNGRIRPSPLARILSQSVRLLVFAGFAGLAVAQTPKFPADIDPVSMSRFPIVERAAMKTDAARAAYDYVVGTAPRQVPLRGPGGVSLYSPGSAEPIDRLNRYLRGESVIGRRLFELCAIIGAWEIEQQYEWSGHEAAALQFGVSQKAVDAIKFNRPLEGLPEDEMVVIQMGRQILRDHKLDSELYAHAVKLFGRQGTMEVAISIGDYVLAGIMLITADQQLPPDRPPLLPAR